MQALPRVVELMAEEKGWGSWRRRKVRGGGGQCRGVQRGGAGGTTCRHSMTPPALTRQQGFGSASDRSREKESEKERRLAGLDSLPGVKPCRAFFFF